MDMIVYGFGVGFVTLLALLSVWKPQRRFALFAYFGGLIGLYLALAVFSDGDLTNGATVLASANGNMVSDWTTVYLVPFFMTTASFMVALLRSFK
jgi:cell division protein FtsX